MAWIVRDVSEADAWAEAMNANSPRITTVICGAILDVALEDALRSRFVDHKEISKSMFKIDGALGSFAPKVRLGFLLGMYDLEERNTLSSLGKIRNCFAHQTGPVAKVFADPDVKKQFEALNLHRKIKHYPSVSELGFSPVSIPTCKDPRDVYITNFRIMRQKLLCDQFYHQPHSNSSATPEEVIKLLDEKYGSREAWLQGSPGRYLLGPQNS